MLKDSIGREDVAVTLNARRPTPMDDSGACEGEISGGRGISRTRLLFVPPWGLLRADNFGFVLRPVLAPE